MKQEDKKLMRLLLLILILVGGSAAPIFAEQVEPQFTESPELYPDPANKSTPKESLMPPEKDGLAPRAQVEDDIKPLPVAPTPSHVSAAPKITQGPDVKSKTPEPAEPDSPEAAAAAVIKEAKRQGASKVFKLAEPEDELQHAFLRLENLRNYVDSSAKIYGSLGIGPGEEVATEKYKRAEHYFARKEFKATIRELNDYLNWVQVTEKGRYLRSQFMLGRSNEMLGQNKQAIRAYLRYLSTYITSREKDGKDLIAVLQHLMPLARAHSPLENRELGQLMAALTSVTFPENQRYEVLYYVAQAASISDRDEVAMQWFEKVEQEASDPWLKSRAIYYMGLIELKQKRYEMAESLMQRVLEFKDTSALDIRDLAVISLARIAVHMKKPSLALTKYNEIRKESWVYPDALFEKIYLYLNTGQVEIARNLTKDYLDRFSDRPDSYQIKTLAGYLDLKAGRVEEAKSAIIKADAQLTSLNDWIHRNYLDRKKLSHRDIRDLIVITDRQIAHASIIDHSKTMFEKLAEAKARLSDVRSDIRNIIYTIGRTEMNQLRPEWVNRTSQLREQSKEALEVGHRLIAMEKKLYEGKITGHEKIELDHSEARRLRLLGEVMTLRREQGDWQDFAKLTELNIKIGVKYEKIKELQAFLAAQRYQYANPKAKGRVGKAALTSELQARSVRLEKALSRAVELVRARKVSNIARRGEHVALQAFMQDYATALHDEAAILSQYREQFKDFSANYLAKDTTEAWQLWEYVVKKLYDEIHDLDKDINKRLNGSLKRLENLIIKHDFLITGIREINETLENLLGDELGTLISHYKSQINLRKSKHKKWLADLEWINYEGEHRKEVSLDAKYRLEQQILNENLKDLQQGALWQWPN